MLYRYLILILFLNLILQASPEVFHSLGNELESFQEDCKGYQKISFLPKKIKKQCDLFNAKINSAFKVGYKLNSNADDKISKKNLNKYLSLLRKLEEKKENISRLIYTQITKARKNNDVEYYSQLIIYNNIKLYSIDYEFMEQNKDAFKKNIRYINHVQYLKDLDEQRTNENRRYQTVSKERKKLIALEEKHKCLQLTMQIAKHYKEAIKYGQKEMLQKANEIYQIILGEKQFLLTNCSYVKDTQKLLKKAEHLDNLLKKNSYNLMLKNGQENAMRRMDMLQKRKIILENDLTNLLNERDRINNKYDRKKKALRLEYEERIRRIKQGY